MIRSGGQQDCGLKSQPALPHPMLFDWGTLSNAGPRRPTRDRELAIYLLTPGFSYAYHQQVLGLSDITVGKYGAWADELARSDPNVGLDVAANAASITSEDGLLMAQRRGASHLVFWSRLAICDAIQRMRSTTDVARIFNCSRRTVQNVIAGRSCAYEALSGRRCPTSTQMLPPGRWVGSATANAGL